MSIDLSKQAIQIARELSFGANQLSFAAPTEFVYNPLEYAWKGHEAYLSRYAKGKKKILFMGMNPGPFGMAQTGVPFGEVEHVRDWLGIDEPVDVPEKMHPKRPIEGFACVRSEVSGRRLWGAFKERFGSADAFFGERFVVNYCPLVFMEASGKNRTPDKMPAFEVAPLYALCDAHLRSLVELFEPSWVIGVGAFAETRAKESLKGYEINFGRILHPSPASPAANRGWAEQVEKQLNQLGLW
ncbi:MAG: uracil-DNA glycosylase family protein [Verrucomicrobiota bacterium]